MVTSKSQPRTGHTRDGHSLLLFILPGRSLAVFFAKAVSNVMELNLYTCFWIKWREPPSLGSLRAATGARGCAAATAAAAAVRRRRCCRLLRAGPIAAFGSMSSNAVEKKRSHRQFVEDKQAAAAAERPNPVVLTEQLIHENTLEPCESCRTVELLFIAIGDMPGLQACTKLQELTIMHAKAIRRGHIKISWAFP